MRYDSDPYIIKKLLTETECLDKFLNDSELTGTVSQYLFDKLAPLVNPLLGTLDHFAKLHTLNPQFSISRFSANQIEQKLRSLQTSILTIFSRRQFTNLREQAQWNKARFLKPGTSPDNEQLLVGLYQKLAQILDTYYVENVRKKHFAALLNEVVGWTEHIETHGHHDIHFIIVFAEKIARDRAIIEHRADVVREICAILQEQFVLRDLQESNVQQSARPALKLSRIYSPYLLNLYKALLDDMGIIVISDQDYHAFEKYCRDNQIDVYEEYHDEIRHHLRKYIEADAACIPLALRAINTANTIMNALVVSDRYENLETVTDILGVTLREDIQVLEHAVRQLEQDYPEISGQFAETIQKVKELRKEVLKPAIQVYSQYMKDPAGFFDKLPHNQTEWIPILESALACLEQDDELYQKCYNLKHRIDQFISQTGVIL